MFSFISIRTYYNFENVLTDKRGIKALQSWGSFILRLPAYYVIAQTVRQISNKTQRVKDDEERASQ